MQEPAPKPHNSSAPESAPQERARVLLELLREQRGDTEMGGLISDARDKAGAQKVPSAEALRNSARELLERIGRKTRPKPAQAVGMMTPAIVRSTVAALVDGKNLTREHPAIIAMVIEQQDRKTQASVLRGLPGRKARKVQRALSGLHRG